MHCHGHGGRGSRGEAAKRGRVLFLRRFIYEREFEAFQLPVLSDEI